MGGALQAPPLTGGTLCPASACCWGQENTLLWGCGHWRFVLLKWTTPNLQAPKLCMFWFQSWWEFQVTPKGTYYLLATCWETRHRKVQRSLSKMLLQRRRQLWCVVTWGWWCREIVSFLLHPLQERVPKASITEMWDRAEGTEGFLWCEHCTMYACIKPSTWIYVQIAYTFVG